MGSKAVLAENTYRFGFYGITAGRCLEPDVAQPVDRLGHHRAAFTQTRMRHHHCINTDIFQASDTVFTMSESWSVWRSGLLKGNSCNPGFELDIDVMMENVKTKSRLQLSEIRCVDMQRLDLRKPFCNVLSTRKEIINYVEEHL